MRMALLAARGPTYVRQRPCRCGAFSSGRRTRKAPISFRGGLMRFIPHFRSRRTQIVSVCIAVVVIGAVLISNALAVHDEKFQLDGDAIASTTTNYNGIQPFDWNSFFDADGLKSPALPNATRPDFTASGFDRD